MLHDMLSKMKSAFPSLRRIAFAYICAVGCWMVVCVLITVQQTMFERDLRNHESSLYLALLLSFRFMDFAALTPPIFFIVRRYPIERAKPLRGLAAYILGAVPFVLIYTLIRILLAPVWDSSTQKFARETLSVHNMTGVIFGTLGDQIAVYITLVVMAHAYTYYRQVQQEKLEKSELEQALAASELQALKNQLHPHFLFNTLHGISTLIDSDRALAKSMVIRLSYLLRAALQHASSDLIRLDDEVAFIQAYLDLEKMRLGPRLETLWQIEPGTRELLVPQMILQPIVENAVRHGIACCRTGGWLEITTRRMDQRLEVEVRNSVGGNKQSGMGVGMSNTKARLRHLYGDEATFSFLLAEGNVATASLSVPAFSSHPAPLSEQNSSGVRTESVGGKNASDDRRR